MNTNKCILLALSLFLAMSHISAQSFLDKVLKGVEKTNQILDETDKILGGSGNSSGNSSSRGGRVTGFKIVSPHPDLKIQFVRCLVSGSTAVVDLVITNYGDDQQVQLGGSSYTTAFDDIGNQYSNIEVSIAGGEFRDWSYASLLTDVPIKFRLQLNGISSKASILKRFNINIHSKILNIKEPIMLYNIPLDSLDDTAETVPSSTTEGTISSQSEMGTLETSLPPASNTIKETDQPLTTHVAFNDIINDTNFSANILSAIFNCKNDWHKLGLRGKVKSMQQKTTHNTNFQFNSAGFLTSIQDPGDYSYTYQYDNKNRITSCITSRKDDPNFDKKTYAYNTNGELQLFISSLKEELKPIYNDNGYIFKIIDKEGNVVQNYNDQGLLTHNNNYSHPYYTYNTEGQCIQCSIEEEGMETLDETISQFTYNKNGDIIKCIRITNSFEQGPVKDGIMQKGKSLGEPYVTTETFDYQYDNNGNWIKRTDSKGRTFIRTITYY